MTDETGNPREKRWAVVTSDGRHIWLGRHTDPDAGQIQLAVNQLTVQGLTGWLAVIQGVYYEPQHNLTSVMVQLLAGQGTWEAAWEAFLARRAETLNDG